MTFREPQINVLPQTTGRLFLVLSGPAPPPPLGLTVFLTSSNTNVATVAASANAFWDGSSPTTLAIQVNAVGVGTATIRATSPNMADVTATVIVGAAVAITNTSLPGGIVNTGYTATLAATGGISPYTWSATALPGGLTLNPSTGVISGSPTAAGTSTVAVTVSDSTSPTKQTATKNLSITVAPALTITTASLPGGTVGAAYSASVAAANGTAPLTWSATGLPAGLTLNSSTGAITGNPTSPGTSNVAFSVTDSTNPVHQTASRTLSITIGAGLTVATTSLSGGVANTPYSATLNATGGTGPYTWAATGLPAGLTLNPSNGVIGGTPTAAGTSNVAVTVTDSTSPTKLTATRNLSLTIAPALTISTSALPRGVVGVAYSANVAAAGGQAPYSFSATGLPAGLTISAGGAITGIPTAAGTSTAVITATDSTNPTSAVATRSLPIVIAPALTISTTSLPGGGVNAAYSATLAAAGGNTPYTWSATGLPAGLTLNAATGAITGTPSSSGTSTVAFTVRDSTSPTQAVATKNLSITIGTALTVTTAALSNGVAGSGYAAQLAAAGGQAPYTWSATGLPGGLTLNASTGAISGTPTAAGTSNLSITVRDSSPAQTTATKNLSLTIAPALAISTTSLPNGAVNSAYAATLAGAGGNGPYHWSATGLPAGLQLNTSTGAISGTPTAAGTSTVAVTLTDSTSPVPVTRSANLSLTILQPLVISTASLPKGVVNLQYSVTLGATGGKSPYTWSATGLPAGLTLNSASGVISGTPTGAASSTVTVTVQDSTTPSKLSATKQLSLVIAAPLSITNSSLPGGNVHSPYSATLAASGGNSPYTWSATGLPSGLSLNTSTGAITGNPGAQFSGNVQVTVRDTTAPTAATASKTLALTIGPAIPASIVPTMGMGQSTGLSQPFGSQLQVSVTDAANSPISGIQVAFAAPASGASLTFGAGGNSVTVITNTAGLALSPPMTANAIAGTYSVTATVAGLSPASFTLQNVGNVPSISVTSVSLGQNLQTTITIGLPAAAPSGGVLLNLSSGDPSRLTLGNMSRATLQITVPEGQSQTTLFVQSVGGTGPVQVSASATGFATGTGTVTITPSAFVLAGPNDIGGSFQVPAGASTTLTVFSARLDATGKYAETQPVRASLTTPINVSVTSSPFGTVLPSTVVFDPSDESAQVTFSANTTGSTTITAAAPPGFATPSDLSNRLNATILSMGFVLPTGLIVGRNLQVPATIALLGSAPSAGLQVTLTSADSTRLRFSASPSVLGSGSLVLNLPAGARVTPEFYVQALASSGSVSYTVQAPGFGTETGSVALAPSAILFTNAFGGVPNPILAAAGGASVPVNIYSARVDASGNWVAMQAVAGGGAVVTISNIGSAAIGSVNPAQVTIAAGSITGSTQFQPGSEGTTTLQISVPGGFSTPAMAYRQLGVSVTRSRIVLTANGIAVGKDLQAEGSIVLNQPAPAGGLAVTLTSSSPSQLRFAPSATANGSGTLQITVPQGNTTAPYFVQGIGSSGTVTYTATASGYLDGTATITLTPSGVVVSDTNRIPFMSVPNDGTAEALVMMAQLDPVTNAYVDAQPLRGGLNLNVTLTSGNTGIATVPSSVTIEGGAAAGATTATVTGKGVGSTNITVTQPPGYVAAASIGFNPRPSVQVNVF
jgi:hypothetical protein